MKLYDRWIENWEQSLTLKDRHRRIFQFQWGTEWLSENGTSSSDPLEFFKEHSRSWVKDSESFFSAPQLGEFQRKGDRLTFDTPTPGSVENNNTVHARIFACSGATSAVIVVPQWNANRKSHVTLCRVLRRLGLTVIRLTLPYHEDRRPPGMKRADLMVSPNIGRTLHATRQAVLEVRQLAHWLRQEGYKRVGVVGTSIGSCVTYLAFVHEPMIDIGVFNHVSSYFADVVWQGLATRYVRWGLEGFISLKDLRTCWSPLSPICFVDRLLHSYRPHLMISARHDLTFLPELSHLVFDRYQELGLRCERVTLPCGHYTVAHFPFKYLDGWHIGRYVYRHLLRR